MLALDKKIVVDGSAEYIGSIVGKQQNGQIFAIQANIRSQEYYNWQKRWGLSYVARLLGLKEVTPNEVREKIIEELRRILTFELGVVNSENQRTIVLRALQRREFRLESTLEVEVYEGRIREVKRELDEALRKKDFENACLIYNYEMDEISSNSDDFQETLNPEDELFSSMLKDVFSQLIEDTIKQLIFDKDFRGLLKLIDTFYEFDDLKPIIEKSLKLISSIHFDNEHFSEVVISDLMQKLLGWLEHVPVDNSVFIDLTVNSQTGPTLFQRACELWEKVGLNFSESSVWENLKNNKSFIDEIVRTLIVLIDENPQKFLEISDVLVNYVNIKPEVFSLNQDLIRTLKSKYIFNFILGHDSVGYEKEFWNKIVSLGFFSKDDICVWNKINFVVNFAEEERAAGRLLSPTILDYLEAKKIKLTSK